MTKAERRIDDWIGEFQRLLEAHRESAPNPACRNLVDSILTETYGWPEFPGLDDDA